MCIGPGISRETNYQHAYLIYLVAHGFQALLRLNPNVLPYDSPLGTLQSLQTAPLSATDTSSTIQVAHIAAWTCYRTFSHSAPHSASSFLGHSVSGPEQHPKEEYVASKIQRGLQGAVPPFWLQEVPDAKTYPSSQKVYLNMSHATRTLEISLRYKAPELLSDLFLTI